MNQQNTMPDRYKRVDGRWGAYVVDTFTGKELDLVNVLAILNTRTPDHTDLLKQARDALVRAKSDVLTVIEMDDLEKEEYFDPYDRTITAIEKLLEQNHDK